MWSRSGSPSVPVACRRGFQEEVGEFRVIPAFRAAVELQAVVAFLGVSDFHPARVTHFPTVPQLKSNSAKRLTWFVGQIAFLSSRGINLRTLLPTTSATHWGMFFLSATQSGDRSGLRKAQR